MKINEKIPLAYVKLSDLDAGDVFEYQGLYFIRTDSGYDDSYTCVGLKDGYLTSMNKTMNVKRVHMEGIIYES